jgi:hypothetical protein
VIGEEEKASDKRERVMEETKACVDPLIAEVQEDVLRYIKRNKTMPISYAVSRRQKEKLNELAKQGQVPKVTYKGEEFIISTDVMRRY